MTQKAANQHKGGEIRMETLNDKIFDVDTSEFEEIVIKGSQDRVIVVDFWAPWCGPCRTLGPILEEVVTMLGPGIALAKVNVDENQQIAMTFGVQGIPAVKVVKDGRLVQEFTGALPKEEVERILRPLVVLPEDTEAEERLSEARDLAKAGDLEAAAAVFESQIEESKEDTEAILGLARIRVKQGHFDQVNELIQKVEPGSSDYDKAQALLAQIGFVRTCQDAGGLEQCQARLTEDPDNLDARFDFATCAAANDDFAMALKEWFTIVERDKGFRNGAAKDAMVAVFRLLGRHNEIVADYPQRLHRTLY